MMEDGFKTFFYFFYPSDLELYILHSQSKVWSITPSSVQMSQLHTDSLIILYEGI